MGEKRTESAEEQASQGGKDGANGGTAPEAIDDGAKNWTDGCGGGFKLEVSASGAEETTENEGNNDGDTDNEGAGERCDGSGWVD